VGESITVRLVDRESGLEVTRSATVSRRSPAREGKWSVGCMLTDLIDWEVFGELFLNEILASRSSK
jgi:hypothetical protein